MLEPIPLEKIYQKKTRFDFLKNFFYRLGGTAEVMTVLVIWGLIFLNRAELGGFTREEILTYILIGNLIGSATGHLLQRIVIHDINRENFALLMNSPLRYIKKILAAGFGKNIFPFILSVAVQIALMYFFIDDLAFNSDWRYLSVILTMVIFAFLLELLILYFLNLLVFWSVESSDAYGFVLRLKKLLAGNYFPLTILPAAVSISLALPFAYSFFVPAELYLKKTDLSVGIRGLGVQLLWIMILYAATKMCWVRKKNRQKIRTEELRIVKD